MTHEGQPAASSQDDYLEVLRFVRAVYEPPVEHVHFEWSESKAKALAMVVIGTLKASAQVHGKSTPAEIDEYVTSRLDVLLTAAMLGPPGCSGATAG